MLHPQCNIPPTAEVLVDINHTPTNPVEGDGLESLLPVRPPHPSTFRN